MNFIRKYTLAVSVLALVVGLIPAANAAFLPGTTPTAPGVTVFPGLVTATPGTLLASVSDPFTVKNNLNVTVATGTLHAAVYRNSNGTLDFYYQVANDASSTDSLGRESNGSFLMVLPEWMTATGFRTDNPDGFTVGTILPTTADRSAVGDVVGFNFPEPNRILKGTTTAVLVVSTDATNFTTGTSQVINNGTANVTTFAPAASTVPEPASLVLIGGGLIALAGIRRFRRA